MGSFDISRLLHGTRPWPFLLEIGLRVLVVYAAMLVALRVLGRRVAAQLTLFELSIAVMLSGAAGVVLQAADRGLLPAIVVIATAVVLQRALSAWSVRDDAIERMTTGHVILLIVDGRLLLGPLRRSFHTRDKVFSALRGKQVEHLGQVARLYVEPSGAFSIVRAIDVRAGLSVLPDNDPALRAETEIDALVCGRCGSAEHGAHGACAHCGYGGWVRASRALDD